MLKRKRQITPTMIVDLLLFNSNGSLRNHSCKLSDNYRTSVSFQGVNKHFNGNTVAFLKQLLCQLIASELPFEDMGLTEIIIKDSTKFKLPNSMSTLYPGTSGSGVNAMANIQFEFEVRSGSCQLKVVEGNYNDQHESMLDEKDMKHSCLYIRDLGYSTISYMTNVSNAGGFFLNKVHSNTDIFILRGDKFELLNLSKIKKLTEFEAFLGAKKYPVRLVVEPVPAEVFEDRLRKRNDKNKRAGRTTSARFKERIKFNILATNLNKESVNMNLVSKLYKLRWQIELIFKSWKSILKLDQLRNVNAMRSTCILYGKLILAILSWKVSMSLGKIGDISILKVTDYITTSLEKFRSMIINKHWEWIECLKEIPEKYLYREQKKGRMNVKSTVQKV
jgi:hypothetical protein